MSNFGQNKLYQYLNDASNKIHGFSIENTENGFILSLIVYREIPMEGTVKLDPVFSFEEGIKYESVVDPILASMRLNRSL